VAKEFFYHRESRELFQKLEDLRQRSGVSRGQAFEDWLTAITCALAAETKEEEYLAMVQRHKNGTPGKRGVDLMAGMFGKLVAAMDKTDADILGDLFQGAITYGENGLYLTPDAITELMAKLTIQDDDLQGDSPPPIINDCCCGTGRMLLEAGKIHPTAELVGQDVDARCAKITGINLGLRGKYGWVICGNALTGETQFAYRIGSFFHEGPNGLRRGVIRDIPPEQTPVPVIAERTRESAKELFDQENETDDGPTSPLPAIIEVPQWLSRLEPKLAAPKQEAKGKPPEEPSPEASPQDETEPDDPPPEQRELF